MSETTPQPVVLVMETGMRSAAYRRHEQACFASGQPFIAAWKLPSGWWRVQWHIRSMNRDRWDAHMHEDADFAALVSASVQRGNRRAVAWTFGPDSGWCSGFREADARAIAAAFARRASDPASFVALVNPWPAFAGRDAGPWPNTLRFDWSAGRHQLDGDDPPAYGTGTDDDTPEVAMTR